MVLKNVIIFLKKILLFTAATCLIISIEYIIYSKEMIDQILKLVFMNADSRTYRLFESINFLNICKRTFVKLPSPGPSSTMLIFLGLLNIEMSWGLMIYLAQVEGYIFSGLKYWWLILPAGLSVTFLTGGFYLVGRGLDEVFNPRLRKR